MFFLVAIICLSIYFIIRDEILFRRIEKIEKIPNRCNIEKERMLRNRNCMQTNREWHSHLPDEFFDWEIQ